MLNYQRVDDFPIEPSHVVGDLPAMELMTQGRSDHILTMVISHEIPMNCLMMNIKYPWFP